MAARELERPYAPERAVLLRHATVGVGQQRERQAVFLGKRRVAVAVIDAHTENFRAQLLHRGVVVAKLTGLGGAAGRIVLGVEIQHHPATPVARQSSRFALLIRQRKIRGRTADHYFPLLGRDIGSRKTYCEKPQADQQRSNELSKTAHTHTMKSGSRTA